MVYNIEKLEQYRLTFTEKLITVGSRYTDKYMSSCKIVYDEFVTQQLTCSRHWTENKISPVFWYWFFHMSHQFVFIWTHDHKMYIGPKHGKFQSTGFIFFVNLKDRK